MRALANGRRLAILKYLKKIKEANVGEISEEIKLSFKATSKHLGILYAVGIVEKDQLDLTINYRLAKDPHVAVRQILFIL